MMLTGFNDGGTLLEGWHDLETDGRQGVSLRSTMERARLRFALPPTARFLAILVSGHASLLGEALRGSIVILKESASGAAVKTEPGADSGSSSRASSCSVSSAASGTPPPNSLAAFPLELNHDEWAIRRFELPAGLARQAGGAVILEFNIDQAVIPNRALRNGDMRAIGWRISAIWTE